MGHTRKVLSVAAKRTTGAVIRNGGTVGSLRITVPTDPISRPVIYTFFEPLKKQLAGKRSATHADVKQAAVT